MYCYADLGIIVFAKAPVSGKVKTRLIPELGSAKATAIHKALVNHTLNCVTRDALASVYLWCAPDTRHEFFKECESNWPIELRRQSGADLGQRMCGALTQMLSEKKYAIIVGTDCPVITSGLIMETLEQLESGSDCVMVPAQDGGYVLMGLQKCDPLLFSDVNWGTSSVLQQTLERLTSLGWKFSQLQYQWDVDRPEDVYRLERQIQQQPQSYLAAEMNRQMGLIEA